MEIRIAKKQDLPTIVEIYNQAIRSGSSTGHTVEFTVADRIDWFENFSNNSYPIYISELENKVMAFGSLSPYRPGRKAMSGTAEISFYVDERNQGKGIGSALVNFIINDCSRLAKENLIAILLDINLESIHLLKKCGFEEWGRLPNVYATDLVKCDHLIYGLSIKKEG